MSCQVGGDASTRPATARLPRQLSASRDASTAPTGARPPCVTTTHGRWMCSRHSASHPRTQSSGRNSPRSSGSQLSPSWPQPMRSGAKTSPPCHSAMNRFQNHEESPMPTGCTSSSGGSFSCPAAAAFLLKARRQPSCSYVLVSRQASGGRERTTVADGTRGAAKARLAVASTSRTIRRGEPAGRAESSESRMPTGARERGRAAPRGASAGAGGKARTD